MARMTMERFFQFLILLTGLSAAFVLSQSHAGDDLNLELIENPSDYPFEVIGTYRVDEVIESTKLRGEERSGCNPPQNDRNRNQLRHFTCGKTVTLARKGEELLVLSPDYSGHLNPFLFDNDHCKTYGFQSRSLEGLFKTNICRALLGATADQKGTSSDTFVFTEAVNPAKKALDDSTRMWATATGLGIPLGAGFSAAYRIDVPVNGSRDQLVIQETTKASVWLLLFPINTEIYRSYQLTRIVD